MSILNQKIDGIPMQRSRVLGFFCRACGKVKRLIGII